MPEPTYVSRRLLPESAKAFTKWAKEQGFEQVVEPKELHVTICFSKAPMDQSKLVPREMGLSIKGGSRSVEPLGNDGAVVLKFESRLLTERWQYYRDEGASWDYDSGYIPHITITYKGSEVDLSKVIPYAGILDFGAEVIETLDLDWKEKITEE